MSQLPTQHNLAEDLYSQAQKNQGATALFCDDSSYSYEETAAYAVFVAKLLRHHNFPSGSVIGVICGRSFATYGAALGVLWHGSCYVPLVNTLPDKQLLAHIEHSGATLLLADANSARQFEARQLDLHCPLVIVPNGPGDIDRSTAKMVPPQPPAIDTPAYIVFTSGSTGIPKGCAPTHDKVAKFINGMCEGYDFYESDRFAQYCDLAFDASVFILFAAFRVGASVYVIPERHKIMPLPYFRQHAISISYLIPSLITLQHRSHQLRPDYLPAMRLLFFGAENLSVETARRWIRCAPVCRVVNFYGPTEVTVSCSAFAFKDEPQRPGSDAISIGSPLPGIRMAIIDSAMQPLSEGESGEIVVSGPQVLTHYWRDEDRSRSVFIHLAGDQRPATTWYRTGDCGFRDREGNYHLLGRIDDQVQLRGRRLEPAHVRRCLMDITGADEVVLIPGEPVNGNVLDLTAFIQGRSIDRVSIMRELRKHLPSYSLPTHLVAIEHWPRSHSGKIDRSALLSAASKGNKNA